MSKNRVFYLDLLKFIAIMMVIIIHVASINIYSYHNSLDTNQLNDWLASNFFNSISRVCVGIFFAVSGAVLLNPHKKNESALEFYQKRLSKIIIPFLIWQIIYLFWTLRGETTQDIWQKIIQVSTWVNLLFYPAYYHLWYIMALISIYLITPFIKFALQNSSKKDIEVFFIIWLIFVVGAKYISWQFLGKTWQFSYLIEMIGFYIFGYYSVYLSPWANSGNLQEISENKGEKTADLSTRKESKPNKIRKYHLLAGLTYLISCFGIFIFTWISAADRGYFDNYFYENIGILTVTGVIGLFVFIQTGNYGENKGMIKSKLFSLISLIAASTLGIYYLHVIILEMLRKISIGTGSTALNGLWPNTFVGMPMVAIIVLIVSTIVTLLLRKLPGLKKLV